VRESSACWPSPVSLPRRRDALLRRPPLIQFVDAPLIVQIFPCFAVLLLAAFPLLLIVRLTRRANPAA